MPDSSAPGVKAGAPRVSGDGGDEAGRIGVLGVVEDLSDRSRLDDLALIHHADAIGGFGDDAEIVGDEDQAHAGFLLQLAQAASGSAPAR